MVKGEELKARLDLANELLSIARALNKQEELMLESVKGVADISARLREIIQDLIDIEDEVE